MSESDSLEAQIKHEVENIKLSRRRLKKLRKKQQSLIANIEQVHLKRRESQESISLGSTKVSISDIDATDSTQTTISHERILSIRKLADQQSSTDDTSVSVQETNPNLLEVHEGKQEKKEPDSKYVHKSKSLFTLVSLVTRIL
jgi:hypothetical protein